MEKATQRFYFFVLALAMATICACNRPDHSDQTGLNEPAASSTQNLKDMNDFKFLAGKSWRVKNRVLKARLVQSTEWDEFEATLYGHQTIAGGYGNIDNFKGERNGVEFEATSIRIFDKNTKEWSIYWVDNIGTTLTYQVKGSFENGLGTFEGQEPFQGKMARLRFIWKDISETYAWWEQAYYDSTRNEWETNWSMEFFALD